MAITVVPSAPGQTIAAEDVALAVWRGGNIRSKYVQLSAGTSIVLSLSQPFVQLAAAILSIEGNHANFEIKSLRDGHGWRRFL
jgi:hypothetical protein